MKYDRTQLKIRQLHFGVGHFHKAHQAYYNHLLLEQNLVRDWGLCSMSLRSPDAADSLKSQNCIYSLMSTGADGSEIYKIGAIKETLFPLRDRQRFREIFASSDLSIATLTITEKGYASQEPDSALGLLCEGLAQRMALDTPITVISCDNLSKNGNFLQSKILQMTTGALQKWIEAKVSFPNSMVDRIVPATTREHHSKFQNLNGRDDSELVATEEFTQWVIEDKFASARPPWDRVGVEFVTDVVPYEKMKLRLLNAAHSFLAYAGQLRGHQFVHESMRDASLRNQVNALWSESFATIPIPEAKLKTYCESLITRFENPSLHHSLKQIAMDGSQKIPIRILEGIHESFASGGNIVERITVVASWLRYIAQYAQQDPDHLTGQDPMYASLDLGAISSAAAAMTMIRERSKVFATLEHNSAFWILLKQALA